jgi:hypothetical protein
MQMYQNIGVIKDKWTIFFTFEPNKNALYCQKKPSIPEMEARKLASFDYVSGNRFREALKIQ